MEEIPKISGVLRGNCCEHFHNISHKKPMKEFTKTNSLTREILFRNLQQLLINKKKFHEVAEGTRFVLFELKYLYILRNSERFESLFLTIKFVSSLSSL